MVDLSAEIAQQSYRLEQAEALLHATSAVFHASPDAILITRNRDGVYAEANEGFTEIAGWTRDEILGRTVAEIDPWSDPLVRAEFTARMRGDGEVRGFEAAFRRKNGTVVDTLVSARLVRFDGEQCTLSVATDVSALKAAEKRILALNRVYTILSGVNQALVRLGDPQEIFEEACRVIVETGGFSLAWVGLVDPDGVHVRAVAHAGVGEDYVESVNVVLGDERLGRGPTGMAILECRHFVCQDIEHDPAMAPWRQSALENDYHSSAAFPLIVNDRAVGALTMYSGEPDVFDDEQIALLDELASDISFSLDFAEREDLGRKAEASLRESQGWLSESQRTARLGHYVYEIEKDWWDGSPALY